MQVVIRDFGFISQVWEQYSKSFEDEFDYRREAGLMRRCSGLIPEYRRKHVWNQIVFVIHKQTVVVHLKWLFFGIPKNCRPESQSRSMLLTLNSKPLRRYITWHAKWIWSAWTNVTVTCNIQSLPRLNEAFDGLCSKHVLTMERMFGRSIHSVVKEQVCWIDYSTSITITLRRVTNRCVVGRLWNSQNRKEWPTGSMSKRWRKLSYVFVSPVYSEFAHTV